MLYQIYIICILYILYIFWIVWLFLLCWFFSLFHVSTRLFCTAPRNGRTMKDESLVPRGAYSQWLYRVFNAFPLLSYAMARLVPTDSSVNSYFRKRPDLVQMLGTYACKGPTRISCIYIYIYIYI